MRQSRYLFLFALFLAIAALAVAWRAQRGVQSARQPVLPKSLPTNIQSAGKDWVYFKDKDGVPVIEVRAREMERSEQPKATVRLKQVQLKLFHKDGKEFDLVKSASAEFDETGGGLFSDGEVEITLAVPAAAETEPPPARLLSIKTSGVHFDAASGGAATTRPVQFNFDRGHGSATGATYDPRERQLHLASEVNLVWTGGDSDPARAMTIQTGQLIYREAEARVYMEPWSKFSRANLRMEGGKTAVTLDKGIIRQVESENAKGSDSQPGRDLEFAADQVLLQFNPESVIEKITGERNAQLHARSASATTRITTNRIDLDFQIQGKESLLQKASANGASTLESRPAMRPGQPVAATRILKSEVIHAQMRAGGEELETVETHSPGTLDFLPNQPAQPKRRLEAERMSMKYAAKNVLESFRAVNTTTRTEKPRAKVPAITSSRDLLAHFDPTTGELKKLEQWNDFRYEEGAQRATAAHATLEQPGERMLLEGQARAWDAAGSLHADRITLEPSAGRTVAEGSVQSTRQPEKKQQSAMLSGEEPLHARAAKMTSLGDNRDILYEGKAQLWQGGNRLEADSIRIRRDRQTLEANGNVVNQLLEAAAPGKAAGVTVVRSESLFYDEKTKTADYSGSVRLLASGMDVRSELLKGFLKEQPKPGESRLERAFADGKVVIFQQALYQGKIRTRRGAAEHAEFYAAEGRVVLRGGNPQLADSLRGVTRGRQLTWFSSNDSLQVEGAETQPVTSRILRN